MLYFAYGSNLHPARLGARVSAPRLVATGRARDRRLAFHKRGRDGSAKCDVPRSPGTDVLGALYALAPGDRVRLDAIEGLGAGYASAQLSIETDAGALEAFTYVAEVSHVDPSLAPFHWYKQLVVAGTRYHGFPSAYVEEILSVGSLPDPLPERAGQHLGMLGDER